MACAELKISVVPNNHPADRIAINIGGTTVTMPANDMAELVIDRLMMRAAETSITRTVQELLKPPRIGQPWLGEAGIYASIVRGDAGQPDYHLIVADVERESMTWKDAGEWAQALWIDGFRDFTLPRRKEQAVLFANVPELFEKECYWSNEEHAGDPEWAWAQDFNYGDQYRHHKTTKLRARAVRRIPIE